MNNKYAVSNGTPTMQSVNKNVFKPTGSHSSSFSFTPRKIGQVTPIDDDSISLERRRKYQYNEKK